MISCLCRVALAREPLPQCGYLFFLVEDNVTSFILYSWGWISLPSGVGQVHMSLKPMVGCWGSNSSGWSRTIRQQLSSGVYIPSPSPHLTGERGSLVFHFLKADVERFWIGLRIYPLCISGND